MINRESDQYGNFGVDEIRDSPAPDASAISANLELNIVQKIATSPETHPLKKVATALNNSGGSLPLVEATQRTGMTVKELTDLSRLLRGVFGVRGEYKGGGTFYSPLFEKPKTQPRR